MTESAVQVSLTKVAEDRWKVLVQSETKILREFISTRERIWEDLIVEITSLKPVPQLKALTT